MLCATNWLFHLSNEGLLLPNQNLFKLNPHCLLTSLDLFLLNPHIFCTIHTFHIHSLDLFHTIWTISYPVWTILHSVWTNFISIPCIQTPLIATSHYAGAFFNGEGPSLYIVWYGHYKEWCGLKIVHTIPHVHEGSSLFMTITHCRNWLFIKSLLVEWIFVS